eukprot:RCo012911
MSGVASAAREAIQDLRTGQPQTDRGVRYAKLRSVLRIYGALCGGLLVLAGLLSLLGVGSDTECKDANLAFSVVSFWIVFLGPVLTLAEMKVKLLLNAVKVFTYRTARSFLYIFLGSLALGARVV